MKDAIQVEVRALWKESNIPGLSVVVVQQEESHVMNFGYADVARKLPVTENTLFEIGSCSKAFTALAIRTLVEKELIDPEERVSHYLPWFYATFEEDTVGIQVKHLLHQTSGIPWNTISKIWPAQDGEALERTVRRLVGQELLAYPGTQYEYATINYDILALIAERVTGQSFESYLQENVIDALNLKHTSVGLPTDSGAMAAGYKISFFQPHRYEAPIYRGNFAAGYVISNAVDMARWVKFHLGQVSLPLYQQAMRNHQRDETVAPHDNVSYAEGWQVSLLGNHQIFHDGVNPNFTSFVAFRASEKIAVIVLANAASSYTPVIGGNVMKLLAGEKIKRQTDPDDGFDTLLSIISIVLAAYVLGVLIFCVKIVYQAMIGMRKVSKLSKLKLGNALVWICQAIPYVAGVLLIPVALVDSTWQTMLVWTPASFPVMMVLLLVAIAVSFLAYLLELFFVEPNEYKRVVPQIVLMSILTGLSGVMIIMMVTSALQSDIDLIYKVFYYALVLGIYLLGRRFLQRRLIKLTNGLMYDLRVDLIRKIFSTSYQKFERVDHGKVYTTLNDDVATIGGSTGMFVALVTSVITVVGAFVYLATIAGWATLIIIGVLCVLSALGFYVTTQTRDAFEQARDVQNRFVKLLHGMIDGYKEISLHRNKKIAYENDSLHCAGEYRRIVSTADRKSLEGGLVGESLLVVVLGFVAFGMQDVFSDIQQYTILSFIMVLLYVIGPINAILQSIPKFTQVTVSWNRIKQFSAAIPGQMDGPRELLKETPKVVSFEVNDVFFSYKHREHGFGIGPINLHIQRGQILFIIGGNGSGKTTLAKLLTGLYVPDEGTIRVDGKPIGGQMLSEYFSAVFSPAYLFMKLYNIDTQKHRQQIDHYLKLLNLEHKVSISKGEYSTLDLSGGQRKRLLLLQCYLEDSPIYIFDEWAADQDPEYRKFFYRVLLPEMRKKGKIVIAITHDDHYFDVADKVLKMDQGVLHSYRARVSSDNDSSFQPIS